MLDGGAGALIAALCRGLFEMCETACLVAAMGLCKQHVIVHFGMQP